MQYDLERESVQGQNFDMEQRSVAEYIHANGRWIGDEFLDRRTVYEGGKKWKD